MEMASKSGNWLRQEQSKSKAASKQNGQQVPARCRIVFSAALRDSLCAPENDTPPYWLPRSTASSRLTIYRYADHLAEAGPDAVAGLAHVEPVVGVACVKDVQRAALVYLQMGTGHDGSLWVRKEVTG